MRYPWQVIRVRQGRVGGTPGALLVPSLEENETRASSLPRPGEDRAAAYKPGCELSSGSSVAGTLILPFSSPEL